MKKTNGADTLYKQVFKCHAWLEQRCFIPKQETAQNGSVIHIEKFAYLEQSSSNEKVNCVAMEKKKGEAEARPALLTLAQFPTGLK